MEKTPKAGDELQLLQAGMGWRTINVRQDADHVWVSCSTCLIAVVTHTRTEM